MEAPIGFKISMQDPRTGEWNDFEPYTGGPITRESIAIDMTRTFTTRLYEGNRKERRRQQAQDRKSK